MGAIHLPWMRQPQALSGAPEDHPILRAMDVQVLVLPSHGLRSRINNPAPTITGAWRSQPASLGVAGDGVGAGFDETGGDITGYFQFPNRTAASTSGNTFAGIFIKTATVSAGSNNFAYWFHFGGTLNTGPAATTTYNNGTQFTLFQDATMLGSPFGITIGVPYFIVAAWEAKGASSAWYIKIRNLLTGKLDSNQSGTATYSGTGTSTWQMCGGSAFGRAFPGYVYLGAMGARYLPSDLADKWLSDPWQIFEPEEVGLVGASGSSAALAGAAIAQAQAAAALSTSIQLVGAALVVATASGSLSTAIPLAGAAVSVASGSGGLTAQIQLAGAAVAQALAAAGLSTGIPLAGGAAGQASATGALTTGGGGLAGDAVARAAAAGALTTQITLTGAAQAIAAATGTLNSTAAALSGAATGQVSATGAITASIRLTAAALAQAAATGSLTVSIQLSGAAAAAATASGSLSVGAVADLDTRFVVSRTARNWVASRAARNWTVPA